MGRAIYTKNGNQRFIKKLPTQGHFILTVIKKAIFPKKLKSPVILPKVEFILENVDIDRFGIVYTFKLIYL